MAKLKKLKDNIIMFNQNDLPSMARQYADISKQISLLEKQKKKLSDKIKQETEKYGVKDDKGSFYYESEDFITGKVAKKSYSINQEKAVEILKSRGLGDVVETVTYETVNEEKLEKAVSEGRISLNDCEEFTNEKVTYSVSVKEKEAMPEVEQTSLKMAARKKK